MRKDRVNTIVADQGLCDDIFLRNFDVSISPDMIHLDGRVLDPPKLELSVSSFFFRKVFFAVEWG